MYTYRIDVHVAYVYEIKVIAASAEGALQKCFSMMPEEVEQQGRLEFVELDDAFITSTDDPKEAL